MKQKGYINIVLVILVVIISGLTGYFTLYQKKEIIKTTPEIPSRKYNQPQLISPPISNQQKDPTLLETRMWQWNSSTKTCDQVGYAPACLTYQDPIWHVCRPLVSQVEFFVDGEHKILSDECYWCMSKMPNDKVNPRNECKQDRTDPYQYFDPLTNVFHIGAWTWSNTDQQCINEGFRNCKNRWMVINNNQFSNSPIGVDQVAIYCDGSVMPGSVNPSNSSRCEQ